MNSLQCFAIGFVLILPVMIVWQVLARVCHRLIHGKWRFDDITDILGAHACVIFLPAIGFGVGYGLFELGCWFRGL